MADRKMVRHRAPVGPSDASVLSQRPHATVIGGGIAGIAAATALAERGVMVEILETQPQLGGRVASWAHQLPNGEPVSMSRGFHAFFRQYYNLRALLRRTDPTLQRLDAVADYPLIDASGRYDSFRGLPRTPPWNALAFALRSPTMGARDLLRLRTRAAAPLVSVSVPDIYAQLDHLDADTFLDRINFPPAARHLAFEVFARSFFAPAHQLSAAELATMFHMYFLGSAEGLIFDVPTDAFDISLWSPLADYLSTLGVTINTRSTALGVDTTGHGYLVRRQAGAAIHTDAVVLATDVAALRRIVDDSPDLEDADWRAGVHSLRTAPPFLVQRLWLDRPLAQHRPAFLATGGHRPLDNISVLDRYERDAAEWARARGGSVVELHAYALPADTEPNDLRQQLLNRLHTIYPETATPTQVLGEAREWHQDCPLFGVGDFARRPRVRTPFHRLVLAGDAIRIDLPVALMERAASTGLHAANCLLASWGLAGHELFTVPTTARSALLRRIAGHRQSTPKASNPDLPRLMR